MEKFNLPCENIRLVKETKKDNTRYVVSAFIGAIVFGIPCAILASVADVNWLMPVFAGVMGAMFLMAAEPGPLLTYIPGSIIYLVNYLLVLLIVHYERNSGSDKTIVISSLGLLLLLILNVVSGFASQMDKRSFYQHFYYAAAGVCLSFLLLFV